MEGEDEDQYTFGKPLALMLRRLLNFGLVPAHTEKLQILVDLLKGKTQTAKLKGLRGKDTISYTYTLEVKTSYFVPYLDCHLDARLIILSDGLGSLNFLKVFDVI